MPNEPTFSGREAAEKLRTMQQAFLERFLHAQNMQEQMAKRIKELEKRVAELESNKGDRSWTAPR